MADSVPLTSEYSADMAETVPNRNNENAPKDRAQGPGPGAAFRPARGGRSPGGASPYARQIHYVDPAVGAGQRRIRGVPELGHIQGDVGVWHD